VFGKKIELGYKLGEFFMSPSGHPETASGCAYVGTLTLTIYLTVLLTNSTHTYLPYPTYTDEELFRSLNSQLQRQRCIRLERFTKAVKIFLSSKRFWIQFHIPPSAIRPFLKKVNPGSLSFPFIFPPPERTAAPGRLPFSVTGLPDFSTSNVANTPEQKVSQTLGGIIDLKLGMYVLARQTI
jgi:hypothetical protein